MTTYLYARLGQISNIEQNTDYQASQRVFQKLNLDHIDIDRNSARPYEEQFWEQYDIIQELNEEEFRKDLPLLVTDPSNKAKVEALLEDRRVLQVEETQRLSAAV